MHQRIRPLLLVIFSLFGFLTNGLAQILDDTTQQVYGLETTRYFTEEDLFLNISAERRIDTNLSDIHRYRYTFRKNNYHQDLANVGTALWPVYFRPELEPGRTHGINIYREYALDPKKIKYYHTKSPYTELKYVQGTQRYADLLVDFARNIKPNFSAGFILRRFTTNKVLATARPENHSEHWSVALQTAVSSPDRRYRLLYNFTHLNNQVNEQGGIKPLATDKIPEDLYQYEKAEVWLTDVSTWERRNTHHLYHQFSIDTGSKANIKIFQTLERSLIKDRFEDTSVGQNAGFYPNIFLDSNSTFFESDFDRIEQKTGVAGIWRGWQLTGHIRSRWLYANLYEDWEQEWYLGGTFYKAIKFKQNDSLLFDLRLEQMLDNDARKMSLNLGLKGFGVKYLGLNRRPSILENRIYSNNFIWDQQLLNMNSNTLEFFYAFKGKKIQLKPSLRADEISNFIYFGHEGTPRQSLDRILVGAAGLDFNFHLGNWHFVNKFVYSTLEGPDVIRFPEFFYNGQYYFSSGFRRGKIDFQIGFEATYRSSYYGNSYMPANFQFYLQDDFPLEQIIIPDFFINLHFRSADAFISVPYFTQGWASPGYFTTPYYTGYIRPEIVEFGFRWRFFD